MRPVDLVYIRFLNFLVVVLIGAIIFGLIHE